MHQRGASRAGTLVFIGNTRLPGRMGFSLSTGPAAVRDRILVHARCGADSGAKLFLLPRANATDVAARLEHTRRGPEGWAKERPGNRSRRFREESDVSPHHR